MAKPLEIKGLYLTKGNSEKMFGDKRLTADMDYRQAACQSARRYAIETVQIHKRFKQENLQRCFAKTMR